MDILERLKDDPRVDPSRQIEDLIGTQPGQIITSNEYYELKTRIHDRLLDLVDLSLFDTLDRHVLYQEIRKLVERILTEDNHNVVPLNMYERERLFKEIQDEVFGLGPLEPFMQDPTVSDILVNTYKNIYLERFGKLEKTGARFKDETHLKRIIDKIVSAVGRRIDESSPMVDARLSDGSRVNAIIPPLAIDGAILSIRRFAVDPLEIHDLIVLEDPGPGDGGAFKGDCSGPTERFDFGWNRYRQDDPVERPLPFYPGSGTNRYHRGFGRTAA